MTGGAELPRPGGGPGHDAAVAGMFGRIASWYDFLNRLLSLGVDQRWRRELAASARPGSGLALDLAAGTLDVALALRREAPDALVASSMRLCHDRHDHAIERRFQDVHRPSSALGQARLSLSSRLTVNARRYRP